MENFEKLYEQVMQSFEESNTAGDGGVFGDTGTASPKVGDYKIDYAGDDSRNLFGSPEKTKSKKKSKGKSKSKGKKKSKFPWLQRRNLTYN